MIMMFLVQFLFVALKLKDSRALEKEIRRKHANIRKLEVKVTPLQTLKGSDEHFFFFSFSF